MAKKKGFFNRGAFKIDPIAQALTSDQGRKDAKKQGALAGRNAAANADVDSRNAARMDQFNTDTQMRGGLIDAQRGGLASTMLNLGGAAGDPTKPFASQMVGTRAAGELPELEVYGPQEVLARKKNKWFEKAPRGNMASPFRQPR